MADPAAGMPDTWPQRRVRMLRAALLLRLPLEDLFRPAAALVLLAGAVSVQWLSRLPPRWFEFACLFVAATLLFAPRAWLRWTGLALLAAGWTMLRADIALAQRLAPALEGVDLVVAGTIRGLPQRVDDDARFELRVQNATTTDGRRVDVRGILRLGWYDTAPAIEPCSVWQLRVRLKRPRGMVDPGAFDFERHALSEGISATGYVREDAGNRSIGSRGLCAEGLRSRISQGIAEALGPGPRADVLRALTFGDQQAMDEREWAVARATGIPHLIAISGLHIALFAGFGVLLVRALWKLLPRLTLRWPAPLIEACASIVFAIGYATLAGLGLPTRRALVMIGVLLAASLLRRARAPVQGLAFAVIVLLVFDPLCVLSPGFWLSFVGVAWLMFCLGARDERRRWWQETLRAQGVASIGLLPLSVWFFGQSSLVGPLANLVAVPWICFFVLPLGVCGALLHVVMPLLGTPLLRLAGAALDLLWSLLERMAQWPGALWYFPEPRLPALALALLGVAWLLLPRGVPARALGMALLLPLLIPSRHELADGEFVASMLDVGQGLSMVVRTRDHALVYDAGARYPSGFDLGNASVVPALHAFGTRGLDRLVISHGDNDHAGGAAAVLAAFPRARVESGEPERIAVPAARCRAGEAWNWNGVAFRFVHPAGPVPARANDRCCVLEVRSGDNALLLTGDISSGMEDAVIAAIGARAAHTILQVAHHGSKTSSSAAFIAALQPDLALVSSGYRNRFHHPAASVVARFAAAGVEMFNTPQSGIVTLDFPAGAPPRVVERGRVDRHPYWRE